MTTSPSNRRSIVVVFGKPGAGKTTISNATLNKIRTSCEMSDEEKSCVLLDLDICIPSWMKENFAKGVYPTLRQRDEFAKLACDYVDLELSKIETPHCWVLISFSFVNTDLRDHFRSRFPNAKWALVDVSDSTAQERIDQREGHFYKGAPSASNKIENEDGTIQAENKDDNNEWDFAPVEFDHVKLNGLEKVESNAEIVINMLKETE